MKWAQLWFRRKVCIKECLLYALAAGSSLESPRENHKQRLLAKIICGNSHLEINPRFHRQWEECEQSSVGGPATIKRLTIVSLTLSGHYNLI